MGIVADTKQLLYTISLSSVGDRIAILSRGSLICCGSFEFLRHNYGRGHQLSLVTRPTSSHPSQLMPSQEREDTDGALQGRGRRDNTVIITQLIEVITKKYIVFLFSLKVYTCRSP